MSNLSYDGQPILFTNYLNLKDLDLFLKAIPKISQFTSKFAKPRMKAYEVQMFFKIMFFTALRVTENINLQKRDFDLKHQILTVRNPKTKKGKTQFTSIPPPLHHDLEIFLARYSDDEQIFRITRGTARQYAKAAGEKADLDVYEVLEEKKIEGVYNHMMRKSYAKFLEDNGAPLSYIMIKGRWKSKTMVDVYTQRTAVDLINWENKLFSKLPDTVSNIFQ